MGTTLHKDLVGADLHLNKLHAATHLVAGTDPLTLAESQITDLPADLADKVDEGDARLTDARTPTAHTHVKADITDFPALGSGDMLKSTYDTDNDGKVNAAVAADVVPWSGVSSKPTLGTASPLDVPVTGNASATQVVKGSDTRLADARAPFSHLHALAAGAVDVTATAAELNILDGVTATNIELNKLHSLATSATELGYVSGVTSAIQTQLGGKAPTSHAHAESDVTNLVTALATKVVGPVSSVVGHLAMFEDAEGKNIEDGGAIPTLVGLGAEAVANKSTNVPTDAASDTKYPSVKAVKDYADGLLAGLLNYRGGYNASGNAYPTTGGSGTAGAVMKGDMWAISVAGTLGGVAIQVGDAIIAKIDTPAQTAGNWNTLNTNVSYVPEDQANKENTTLDTSTVKYPTNNLVKTGLDGKASTVHAHVKGDVTDFPASLPASDVSAWAKAGTKPAYTPAEIGSPSGSGSSSGSNTGDQTLSGLGGVATGDSRLTDARTPTAHTHVLTTGATDITATAAELNVLDGITATVTELNYTDGVTSAIQTQFNAITTVLDGLADALDLIVGGA